MANNIMTIYINISKLCLLDLTFSPSVTVLSVVCYLIYLTCSTEDVYSNRLRALNSKASS